MIKKYLARCGKHFTFSSRGRLQFYRQHKKLLIWVIFSVERTASEAMQITNRQHKIQLIWVFLVWRELQAKPSRLPIGNSSHRSMWRAAQDSCILWLCTIVAMDNLKNNSKKKKQVPTNDILFTTKVTLLMIYYLQQGDIADWMPFILSWFLSQQRILENKVIFFSRIDPSWIIHRILGVLGNLKVTLLFNNKQRWHC